MCLVAKEIKLTYICGTYELLLSTYSGHIHVHLCEGGTRSQSMSNKVYSVAMSESVDLV